MVHSIPHRLFTSECDCRVAGQKKCPIHQEQRFFQPRGADRDVATLKAYVSGEHKISSRHFVVSFEAKL
jgi:ribosomal protein S18